MTLPDFVICGAQKSGTTSLYHYLSQHPEICMSETKEVHFFCWEETYRKGQEWYEKHFSHCKESKKIGEATPYYMYHPKVPGRMNKIIPDAKLMFILRNPIDRAYSHYWHERRKGRERLSFEEAIRKEKKRIEKNSYNRNHYSYLYRGKYAKQIRRFLSYYDKNDIFVLIFEKFKENTFDLLRNTFEFLEVDSDFMPNKIKKKNVGKKPKSVFLSKLAYKNNPFSYELPYSRIKNRKKLVKFLGWKLKNFINNINLKQGYPEMDLETRDKLIEYFEPYNSELEDLLNIDINSWKTS